MIASIITTSIGVGAMVVALFFAFCLGIESEKAKGNLTPDNQRAVSVTAGSLIFAAVAILLLLVR